MNERKTNFLDLAVTGDVNPLEVADWININLRKNFDCDMHVVLSQSNDKANSAEPKPLVAAAQDPQVITYDVMPSDDPAIIGADIVSTIDLLLKDMSQNPRAVHLNIFIPPVTKV
ncbi:hypothetical protein IAG25_25420 [Caballeronia sp. EK]|uniref:hypothetical protein n=1 Tax=Caballeronia sp. EK TaxID=2767469 RepID=UPI0019A7AD49|nr:hypothetical protein [Caballeronia sp. EK]MBC8640175.1 hypothetical protein [Caballeronia sp. EK]